MTAPRTAALRRLRRAGRLLADRPWYPVAALGVLLCALGWYGVSGERYTARQLPYLASASIPGAALLIAAAVLLARRRSGSATDAGTRRRVAELHAVLLEAADDFRAADADRAAEEPYDPYGTGSFGYSADAQADPGPVLTLPGSTLYHRPDCRLVRGRPDAAPVPPTAGDTPRLTPCPVCRPGPAPED